MTLRLALVVGPMYDGLYRLLEGQDVEIVVHADHPTLNRRVAELLAREERIDLLATHSKYAPSQAAWLRPLDGVVAASLLVPLGRECATNALRGRCPNCGGELVARPRRPAALLAKYPASTERVHKLDGCRRAAS